MPYPKRQKGGFYKKGLADGKANPFFVRLSNLVRHVTCFYPMGGKALSDPFNHLRRLHKAFPYFIFQGFVMDVILNSIISNGILYSILPESCPPAYFWKSFVLLVLTGIIIKLFSQQMGR
jgi:hypothetical protein